MTEDSLADADTLMTFPASSGSIADAAPRPSSTLPTLVRRRWRRDGVRLKTIGITEAAATICQINAQASVCEHPDLLRREKDIRKALERREVVLTPAQRWEAV